MKFKELLKKIKDIKIQGATNIAKAGVKSMSMKNFSKKKLLAVRPTEPLLRNSLEAASKFGSRYVLKHFEDAEKKLAKFGAKKIKGTVFTHCHSSNVMAAFKEAKKQGKKFEVFNTETRPKFQGRKTATELSKLKIKVTNVVDAAAGIALRKTKTMKKTDAMVLGCDAIFKDASVVNKVGSGMFAEIAHDHKIPVYVITDSWKFSPRSVKIEMRDFEEVWKNAPRKVKIKNPAFEIVDAKFITAIISELGILKPKKFAKKVRRVYKWI